jgi:release factor glutamine methyltransferase
MKIASNKLSNLFIYYSLQLVDNYDKDELYAIFELVCEHYLGFSKLDVKTKINDNINQSELINIYNTCNELKTGKPIQYILEESYFFDLKLKVNSSVLIPRPETEELVYLVNDTFSQNKLKYLKIIDIGTGSGCIPIALKNNFKNSDLYGIDVSEDALNVAITNAKINNIEVKFFLTDILKTQELNGSPYDIIISNPPYVLFSESKQMDIRVLDFEPSLALFVEENDPIIFYKKIIDLCLNSLSENGCLFFELNPLFANDVMIYAGSSNLFKTIEIIKDMSGKERFLKAQKK